MRSHNNRTDFPTQKQLLHHANRDPSVLSGRHDENEKIDESRDKQKANNSNANSVVISVLVKQEYSATYMRNVKFKHL